MNQARELGVWFPTVRTGTGTDVFTERLAAGLAGHGIRAEITWLPLRAEYAPWTVPVPKPPAWATVVHVNSWLHPRFLPKKLPIVASVHHCVHDPAFRPYKSLAQALYHRLYIKPIEQAMLCRSAAIVAVSRFTADRTRAVFNCGYITLIANGVEINAACKPRPVHLPHDPFKLLFVGTGSRRKGVDLLAPIMEQLGPKFELSVVGTSLPGRYSLPINIHVKGRLPTRCDLTAAYREADALLFPSRLEGFGLVVVEAMMCGLPVVTSRSAALPEVVDHGITGLLCTQDDIEEFADAIRRLAANPELRIAMARAARVQSRQRFAVNRMVDCYVETYQSVLYDNET